MSVVGRQRNAVLRSHLLSDAGVHILASEPAVGAVAAAREVSRTTHIDSVRLRLVHESSQPTRHGPALFGSHRYGLSGSSVTMDFVGCLILYIS
jgi:hypothetical protein